MKSKIQFPTLIQLNKTRKEFEIFVVQRNNSMELRHLRKKLCVTFKGYSLSSNLKLCTTGNASTNDAFI